MLPVRPAAACRPVQPGPRHAPARVSGLRPRADPYTGEGADVARPAPVDGHHRLTSGGVQILVVDPGGRQDRGVPEVITPSGTGCRPAARSVAKRARLKPSIARFPDPPGPSRDDRRPPGGERSRGSRPAGQRPGQCCTKAPRHSRATAGRACVPGGLLRGPRQGRSPGTEAAYRRGGRSRRSAARLNGADPSGTTAAHRGPPHPSRPGRRAPDGPGPWRRGRPSSRPAGGPSPARRAARH